MPHYDITVSGRVQGVFFRASARDEAMRLHLTGYVRNQEDGAVYAEAEGDPESLARFVAWCRRGPPQARVESVQVSESPPVGYRGFQVRD
jgi:acylphosphatase